MDAALENRIRQEQVESFGRLMAGFSHEMKNHLGIIRESNGLMGDLLDMGAGGLDEVMGQRLQKSISSIEQRVVLAANMFHYLSTFAHRSDRPCSSFQINELLKEASVFLERFSKLKQVVFTLEFGEEAGGVYNDPALLHHIIYRLFMKCIDVLGSDSRLSIHTGEGEGNERVIFRLSGQRAGGEIGVEEGSGLAAALEKLQGSVQCVKDENDLLELVLTVPSLSEEQGA